LWGRYEEIPETLFYARVHPQACGNQRTKATQRSFINPLAKGRWDFSRLGLLGGYAGAVCRARLSLSQRLQCSAAILRYLFQVKKWKSVLLKTLRGAGLAAEYPAIAPQTANSP
jgi:hypothetical protein